MQTEEALAENYKKYRGKCKRFAEEAIAADPTLRLVRGHYICPFWGAQAHWWCEHPDGSVRDPTALQFPSAGMGEYIEFDGVISCSECGKWIKEEDADIDGNYAFCSLRCHAYFVGVPELAR